MLSALLLLLGIFAQLLSSSSAKDVYTTKVTCPFRYQTLCKEILGCQCHSTDLTSIHCYGSGTLQSMRFLVIHGLHAGSLGMDELQDECAKACSCHVEHMPFSLHPMRRAQRIIQRASSVCRRTGGDGKSEESLQREQDCVKELLCPSEDSEKQLPSLLGYCSSLLSASSYGKRNLEEE
jgi:hypothetical protein